MSHHVHNDVQDFKSSASAKRRLGRPRALRKGDRGLSEARLMAKEIETCRAAMLRFNRAATLASLGSIIAHEVGQPLAVIVCHARAGQRWLAGGPATLSEAAHSLAEIERAAWRASAIVDSLRALVTADHANDVVFDLNHTVEETWRLLGERAHDARLTLERQLTDASVWVRGDQVQIQQVLLNLVVNAIQAMGESPEPARLTVRVAIAQGSAVLQVSDTGPGLSPDKIRRVFEPLYTTKPGGVGMGLALCRQIAESHGGTLCARSPREGGAVFTLSLPLVSAPFHGPHAPGPVGQGPGRAFTAEGARP